MLRINCNLFPKYVQLAFYLEIESLLATIQLKGDGLQNEER